jgi:hypothetical protein
VFSARGGYTSGTAFVTGLTSAVWVGAAVVAIAAVVALALPRLRRAGAVAISADAAIAKGDAAEGAVAGTVGVAAAEGEPARALASAR